MEPISLTVLDIVSPVILCCSSLFLDGLGLDSSFAGLFVLHLCIMAYQFCIDAFEFINCAFLKWLDYFQCLTNLAIRVKI